jgi:hypothetical protein
LTRETDQSWLAKFKADPIKNSTRAELTGGQQRSGPAKLYFFF